MAISEEQNSSLRASIRESGWIFTIKFRVIIFQTPTPCCMRKTYSQKLFSKPEYKDLSEKSRKIWRSDRVHGPLGGTQFVNQRQFY